MSCVCQVSIFLYLKILAIGILCNYYYAFCVIRRRNGMLSTLNVSNCQYCIFDVTVM